MKNLQWHDLTAGDIERVQDSFDHVWAVSQRTIDLFYGRLFEIAPELRPLFRSNMDHLKQKFISTLAVIVGSLNHVEIVFPMVDSLAKNHVQYGVQPAYYEIVGEALLWSLERGLGPRWTPDVAESWTKAYAALSAHMIKTAYP